MKIIRITRGILLVLLITFTGCMGTPVKFNTMPEQPYDATRGREVRGGSCGFQLLTFIPIMINDRAQRAYDRLVAAAGGDYVTDIKVNERWSYAFVGTVYCTEMKATAYPRIVSSTGAAAQEEEKASSIDECIEACKKNTSRTAEQCFDACKR